MVPFPTTNWDEYDLDYGTATSSGKYLANARFRLTIVPRDFYYESNRPTSLLQDVEDVNDPYYFLKWWHRFTCIKEYPVKPVQKIVQVKMVVPVLVRKQCDSRSGVKGRTIRKRQGLFYKMKRKKK